MGKAAANGASWGGGQAQTEQFAYWLLQTTGSESAVNGTGIGFLPNGFFQTPISNCKAYLSLSSGACCVSVSELKRQARGRSSDCSCVHLKTFWKKKKKTLHNGEPHSHPPLGVLAGNTIFLVRRYLETAVLIQTWLWPHLGQV